MNSLLVVGAVAVLSVTLTACGGGPEGFESRWCDLPRDEAVRAMLTKHQGYDASDGMTEEEWDSDANPGWPIEDYHAWLDEYAECSQ